MALERLEKNQPQEGGIIESPLIAHEPEPVSSFEPEPPETSPMGALQDLITGIPRGVAQTFTGAGKMLQAFAGAPPQIEEVEPTSLPGEYGRGLGSALAPLSLMAAGAALGTGVAVPAVIGLGVMGLAEAWDAYQRELARQQEEEGGFDKEKALRKAALYGAGSTALELGVGRIGRFVGVDLSDTLYRTSRKFTGSAAMARLATDIGSSVAENMAEEASQRALQDIIVEGKLTPGIVEEGIMGGLIGPPSLMLGRAGIRAAQRLRAAITGREPTTTAEELLRAAGIESAHASAAAEWINRASDIVADAKKILPSIATQADLEPYLTDRNRNAIAAGKQPDPFAEQGKPDGAALIWNVYEALAQSGLILPNARLNDEQRAMLGRAAESYTMLSAADRISSRYGGDVAKKVLQALQAIYENKDIETSQVPLVAGKPADQRAERAIEARAEERRAPRYQAPARPKTTAQTQRSARQEIFAAIRPEDLRERVGALLAVARKRFGIKQEAQAPEQKQEASAPQKPAVEVKQPPVTAPGPAAVVAPASISQQQIKPGRVEEPTVQTTAPTVAEQKPPPTEQPPPAEKETADDFLMLKLRERLDAIWQPLQSDLRAYAGMQQSTATGRSERKRIQDEIRRHLASLDADLGPQAARQLLLNLLRAQAKLGINLLPSSSRIIKKYLSGKELNEFKETGRLPEPSIEYQVYAGEERRELLAQGAPQAEPEITREAPRPTERPRLLLEPPRPAPEPPLATEEAARETTAPATVQEQAVKAETAQEFPTAKEQQQPAQQETAGKRTAEAAEPARRPATEMPESEQAAQKARGLAVLQRPRTTEQPYGVLSLPIDVVSSYPLFDFFHKTYVYRSKIRPDVVGATVPLQDFLEFARRLGYSKTLPNSLAALVGIEPSAANLIFDFYQNFLRLYEDSPNPFRWSQNIGKIIESLYGSGPKVLPIIVGVRLERIINGKDIVNDNVKRVAEENIDRFGGIGVSPNGDIYDYYSRAAVFDKELATFILTRCERILDKNKETLARLKDDVLFGKLDSYIKEKQFEPPYFVGPLASSAENAFLVFLAGGKLISVNAAYLIALLKKYPRAKLYAVRNMLLDSAFAHMPAGGIDGIVAALEDGTVLGLFLNHEHVSRLPGTNAPIVPVDITIAEYRAPDGRVYRFPNWFRNPDYAPTYAPYYIDAALVAAQAKQEFPTKARFVWQAKVASFLSLIPWLLYDKRVTDIDAPNTSKNLAASLDNNITINVPTGLFQKRLFIPSDSILWNIWTKKFWGQSRAEQDAVYEYIIDTYTSPSLRRAIYLPGMTREALEELTKGYEYVYYMLPNSESFAANSFLIHKQHGIYAHLYGIILYKSLANKMAQALTKRFPGLTSSDLGPFAESADNMYQNVQKWTDALKSKGALDPDEFVPSALTIRTVRTHPVRTDPKKREITKHVSLSNGKQVLHLALPIFAMLKNIKRPYKLMIASEAIQAQLGNIQLVAVLDRQTNELLAFFAPLAIDDLDPLSAIIEPREGEHISDAIARTYAAASDLEILKSALGNDIFAIVEAYNRGIIHKKLIDTYKEYQKSAGDEYLAELRTNKLPNRIIKPTALAEPIDINAVVVATRETPTEPIPSTPEAETETAQEPAPTRTEAVEPRPPPVQSTSVQPAAPQVEPAPVAQEPPAQAIITSPLQNPAEYSNWLHDLGEKLLLPYYHKELRELEFDDSGRLTERGLEALKTMMGTERARALGLIKDAGYDIELASRVAKHSILAALLRPYSVFLDDAIAQPTSPLAHLWDIMQSGAYDGVLNKFFATFRTLVNLLVDGRWWGAKHNPLAYISAALLLRREYDLAEQMPADMRPARDPFAVSEAAESLSRQGGVGLAALRASYITRELAKNIDLLPQLIKATIDAASKAYQRVHLEDASSIELRGIEKAFYADGLLPIWDDVIRLAGRTPLERGELIYAAVEHGIEGPAAGGAMPLPEDELFEVKGVDEFIGLVEQMPNGFELAVALRAAKRMGLFELLPGLKFAIGKMPDGRILAYYDSARNVIAYTLRCFDQPWKLTSHELLHALFEALPDEDRALVRRLRLQTIQQWMGTQALFDKRSGAKWLVLSALSTGIEPALRGRLHVPADVYHLSSDSEFFVWMLEGRLERALRGLALTRLEQNLLQRWWNRIAGIIQKVIAWAKDLLARIRPGYEPQLRDAISRFWDRIARGDISPNHSAAPKPPGEPTVYFALAQDDPVEPYLYAVRSGEAEDVEAARRFATAYVRGALEQMAGAFNELKKEWSFDKSERKELQAQKETDANLAALIGDIDRVIDLERFRERTGLDFYEPSGFARLVEEVIDFASRNPIQAGAALRALRNLRSEFYNWSAYLYARDLAEVLIRRDAAARQLAYYLLLRENKDIADPGQMELVAQIQPEFDVALPDLETRIAELDAELRRLEQEVADSERELDNFISRHATAMAGMALENERWPLLDIYNRLVEGKLIEGGAEQQYSPDLFAKLFRMRVEQLVQIALTRDTYSYRYRVLQKLLLDDHLKAFARGDYRVAEIGLPDLAGIINRALEAIYNPSETYADDQRRVIATCFVHAVLKFNVARDRAFQEYQQTVRRLGPLIEWNALKLLTSEKLSVVADRLWKILDSQQWPPDAIGSIGFSKAEVVHGLLRFATMVVQKIRQLPKEQRSSAVMRFFKAIRLRAASIVATPMGLSNKADAYKQLIADAFVEAAERPQWGQLQKKDIGRIVGLSDPMLVVVMDWVVSNPSIARLITGFASVLLKPEYETLAKTILKRIVQVGSYLKKRQKLKAAKKGEGEQAKKQETVGRLNEDEIILLRAHIETVLSWIEYEVDPRITALRRELIEAKAELDAIRLAMSIWDGLTRRDFPKRDGSGDTPFWTVWHDAVALSGLSRVMAFVGPEEHRAGTGTVIFLGFDMPQKDPQTGNTQIVHIPEVIISPSAPNPSDVIQEELKRWVEAATMYVLRARSAEARYRQYLEQIRGLTEEELESKIEAGEIVEAQSPEALGYDIVIANGLQNALLTHAMYFSGNIPLDFTGQPEHESGLLRFISSTRFTHTLEQLASWIPQPYRASVRIWMARWANMRLTTSQIYNDYLPKILDAKLRAMRAFGTTSEYEYRQLVWAPLTEYARQHGVRVEAGIKLRTGHVVNKEDIELLRLVYHFERELLHAAQKIHGHDPNLGVADAVIGTMFTVGGVKYARYAASVGTYGLPRHINAPGYMLIDKLAVAYARLADDPEARNAYRELLTKGVKAFEARPVSYQHDLDNPPVFELLMEPWFAAAVDGAAESYLVDALRHRSDIAIERDDVWLRVLRRAAQLFLEERKAERKQVVHGVVLQPVPVQWSDVIDYIARAAIELRAIEAAEFRARAYAQHNVFRDLDAMARYALAAVDADRFRDMAVKAAEVPGRTFLNEFTKPAGTLWLPSALYSYGALTEGEMQMSIVRAQAYTFVEFALAVRRARRHLEESVKAVATATAAHPADLGLLRKTLSLVRALEEALVSLAALTWTGRTARDPLFLSLVKSTLLSNIVVTLRNLTLGPILAWIHNAQLLNISRALTALLTLKQAVKAAAGFVVDLAASGARMVTKTFGILPALVQSMGSRQKLRELLESYLDNIANAAITDTVRSVSNTGFSLSRRTVQLAYFTWLFHKVHRFIYDEILWIRPGIAGMAHRAGRKMRAAASAATQILRSVGTELADTYLNSMALDSAVAIERHLEEIAENVYNRLKAQGVLGDLLETIVPSIVHPASPFALRPEDISARRTEAERAEHAAELRQLFNEAGINLDTLILGAVKRMAEHQQARMRESQDQIMPASPKAEISVLSDQQRIDLIRALMRRFNQGDIINRPIVAILDTTRRTILTFMGYSINFLHQLIGFIAGKPGIRWPDKLLLMLWKLLWLALIVLLFGQISIKTTNEVKQFIFNEPPTVPTVFDVEFYKNWTLVRRSLFFSALLGLPLIGDLIARAAGVVFGNRGWSLTDRVLAIRLVDDFVSVVFNTSRNLVSAVTSERPISSRTRDIVEPAFQALMRYVWFATPFIRAVSETKDVAAELRQARNLARYYSLVSGIATGQKPQTPSPVSTVGADVIRQRILNDIAAAAARRDTGALQSALEELVTYFKERGSEDPVRSAQAALQSINPFYKVADDRTPDDAEIAKILSNMPEAHREGLAKPYADFLWAKNESLRVLRRATGGAGAVGQPFRGIGRARPAVSIRVPSIRSRAGRVRIPTPPRLASRAEAETAISVLPRPLPPPARPTTGWLRGLGQRRAQPIGVPRPQSVGRVPKISLGRGIATAQPRLRSVPTVARVVMARRRYGAGAAAQALRVPIGKA